MYYYYKTPGKDGTLEPYSGKFSNDAQAKKWRKTHGEFLSKLFNRKLVLTTSTNKEE